MNFNCTIAALMLLANSFVRAQSPVAAKPLTRIYNYLSDNNKKNKLDSVIEAQAGKFISYPENCGLSIGISINGQHFFYNYGEVKRSEGKLPDNNTIYEAGALTSAFCGFLLAKAVVEKKALLGDDIRKYLPGDYPDLVFNKKCITLKQLITHSSGLANIPEDLKYANGYDSLSPYKHYSREKLLNYVKNLKPGIEPGTTCGYSNMGLALLGIVLEQIYDQSFTSLVKEKITVPLQMTHTGFKVPAEHQALVADGYNASGNPTPHWDLNGFEAAGGLNSSSGDLVKFLDYQLSEADTAVKLSQRISYTGRQNLAMAWFMRKTTNENMLYSLSAATFGSGGFTGFIPQKKCAVVVLVNSSSSVDHIGLALLKFLEQ